ncbi:ankyrin repeat-containing domain protein [Flagelloscypha sp. PMI_526]|nr:ankyrin repeat-containing domain protein [Flagelloscypha sp. PMI_526]
MAALRASIPEPEGITALALDGSPISLNTLSELYILQEAAGRWAFSKGMDLRGEDVRPIDMFDIIGGTEIGGFYAVLFVSLKMTIGQAIQSHRILERRLFSSDAWNNKIQQACVETLNAALDEIVKVSGVEMSLDLPFEQKNPQTKCFVCVINTVAANCCRLLRNYHPRTGQGPRCTIRQVFHATLSNHVQLPAVVIEEERFLSALNGYANPTHILVKELCNAFVKGTQVACLASVGAGEPNIQPLINKNSDELGGLLRSCQLVADDVAAQCHDLGSFYFRLSVSSGLVQESQILETEISRVKGLTIAYLLADEISTRLNNLDEKLCERFGLVSIERLNSVAGKDGESRVAARLAKVEEHLNDTLFQNVLKWLKPIDQTSKLDANIRARSGITCRWLLENSTFLQWMQKRGLFWFRGLMGTGKTVISSFIMETLLARNDVYLAYYYFEFTNPTTLSEEALLRSLVCQLARSSPETLRALHQKHSNGDLQPQLSTLQATLNDLVTVSAKPVFIIIDALDELPIKQRKYLLQFLVTFSASNSVSGAHVMVTSREEVDIYRALRKKSDFEVGVQDDLVRQDIAAFVDRELESEKWTFWSPDAIDIARRLLKERADGQFRMVACQLDILQQVNTYDQLWKSLHHLPKTLGETYDYILENIPEHLRNQAHRLFAILSFAPDSISTNELSALLAVEFGDEDDTSQLPEFREINQMVDPLDVVGLGTSLVSSVGVHPNFYLQLAHASVKEHLLAPSATWFSLSVDLAQGMIAQSCLALLLHFHILQQKEKASYDYSSDEWFNHVLPNGPQQLLRQQQQIYMTFPWPYINRYRYGPYKRTTSPLVSAASLGLFDLIKTLLHARSWDADELAQALVAAASAERVELISIRCCHALIVYGANVNAFVVDYSSERDEDITSSPLQNASLVGNLEVVRFLIGMGADVNASEGVYGTALQACAYRGDLEIVQVLVENGADVNTGGGEYGSALQAASLGKLETVRFLIEKGADVNASGGKYGTALQAAASLGKLKTISLLIENGAYINANGGEFGTALQAAAYLGKLDTIRFLVEKGAHINTNAGLYGTALQAGAYCGSLETVSFLLESGADVNASGGEYGSALQASAYRKNLDIVRFLIEKGADVNAGEGSYGPALPAGACSGDLGIVHLLVEKGADVNASGGAYGTALQAAAHGGNLEAVRFLVEKGANVNSNGGLYGSPLQAGASHGNLDIVRFLVEKGADVNARGGRGTALQAASCAYGGGLEIVQFLLEKGSDMNASEGEDGSALQAAASLGKLETVRFLVEKGADVNSDGGLYGSPLQASAQGQSLEIVRFLIEKGADVNACRGLFGTALQAGACRGKLETVRFLIENGADVNASGGEYGTALQAASRAYYKRPEVVRLLVANGADVNARGGKYGSALQAASLRGNLEIVLFLIEKGAYVNALGGRYGTALQAAASKANLRTIDVLIEKGANVNITEGRYGTALQAAAYRGKLEIVRFLIENGAYVNTIGGEHKTALDAALTPNIHAISAEKHDIAQFLKSRGSKTWDAMVDLSNDMWDDMKAWGWPSKWDRRWLLT